MSGTNIGFNPIADLSRITVAKMSRQSAKHRIALLSGNKINTISDDASGFSLARGPKDNRRGFAKALDNIGNAKNLLNTIIVSYDEINELLMKIKELAVQGADGAFDTNQRNAIQGMIDAALAEIDDIVNSTVFQASNLIDGSFTGKTFQTGAYAGVTFNVDLDNADTTTLGVVGVNVNTSADGRAAMDTVDNALALLARAMQKAGEYFLRLEAEEKTIRLTKTSIERIRSQIEDADFDQEQMASQRIAVLMEMGFTSLKDAIAAPQQVLSLFA